MTGTAEPRTLTTPRMKSGVWGIRVMSVEIEDLADRENIDGKEFFAERHGEETLAAGLGFVGHAFSPC